MREATRTPSPAHYVCMSAEADSEDWYFREWLAHQGKSANQLVADLDFHRTTAYRLLRGDQPYRKDFVVAIARWLNIRPYELLMPPEEAMALRRLKQTAMAIAADMAESDQGEGSRARAG